MAGRPREPQDVVRWILLAATAAAVATALVVVVISQANKPAPRPVPDVRGLTETVARSQLEHSGLVPDVLPAPGTKLCIEPTPATVALQDPPAATVVPAGSSVRISMKWTLCPKSIP